MFPFAPFTPLFPLAAWPRPALVLLCAVTPLGAVAVGAALAHALWGDAA